MADKNNKVPLVYCFLDTNILIQFQTYNEVDWPKVLNAKQVCLVLAPIVLRELDKHKTDYNNSRLQRRARMLLPKLNALLEMETAADELPQVRQNVTLMVLREPLLDWMVEGLDRDDNDDRLIGSILEFSRQHPSETILLLSDDSGPRFKAKSYNLPTLSPTNILDPLNEPPTPEEIENRKLRKQLQELTDRTPKLTFGIYENQHIVDTVVRPLSNTWRWDSQEDYVRKEIAKKRAKLAQMLKGADETVKKEEIEKFKGEYEKYIAQLEPELKMQFIKNYAPFIKLDLVLDNQGTASATDIDLQITFPKGSSVIVSQVHDAVTIEVALPKEPTIPEWARIKDVLSWPNFSSFPSFMASMKLGPTAYPVLQASRSRRDTYESIDFPFGQNILHRKIEKLGHLRQAFIKSVTAFLPETANKRFTASYSILADEFPQPITGELKVQWG